MGTPDKNSWPDVVNLQHYKDTFPKWSPTKFDNIILNLSSEGIDLLSKMLVYDPNMRITAKQALLHVK